jgi:hypothetical protein
MNKKIGLQIKKHLEFLIFQMLDFQWTLLGLNQRPSDYESDALTN